MVDRDRSLVECIPSRPAWTTEPQWLPVRCRATPSAQKHRRGLRHSDLACLWFVPGDAGKGKRSTCGERIDFVSVTTPNHTHYEIAKAAVEAGFNVVCDKPMTFDLKQAEDLAATVAKSDVVFALTHNYTGYPLVRQAREMILGGELGEIQAVRACYIQGWLRTRLEESDQKQAAWRTDPSKSGAAGCFGDIATHAYNLGRYMTGLLPAEISCHLKTFESGRKLDDIWNGYCALR